VFKNDGGKFNRREHEEDAESAEGKFTLYKEIFIKAISVEGLFRNWLPLFIFYLRNLT